MTYRTKPVATRETVAVPEWAAHLRTGDVVTVERRHLHGRRRA